MSHASSAGVWRDVERAARPLGLQLLRFDVPNVEAMNDAFAQAVKQGVGAMIVGSEVIAALDRQRAVIDLAARHKLPVIYPGRQAVDAGGLISYGVDYPHLYHRAASYVDRILKGAKPGDLPIEQPTKLELVINLKAAKALGIAVPQRLLLRADQVIE
jgi:putative ABC transport system substrate-binding protein